MIKHISLGEIAIELGINKSKLAYYFQLGLLTPIAKVGRMNIFDRGATLAALKKIGVLKEKGKTLKKIKEGK
jgi:DNA-binding transcriptional MerR regulator